MNEVTLKIGNFNGEFVVQSTQVALMVDKKHGHLMRDIRGYEKDISENPDLDSQDFFIGAEYKTEGNNKTYDCYLLTKKGCEFVANKLTGKKGNLFTATYINRFNAMESDLKKTEVKVYSYMIDDPIQRAEQWIIEHKEKVELQSKLEIAQPKAEYLDTIIQNSDLLTVTQIAKDYGLSGQAMNELLHKLKIQFKSGNVWLLYSNYQDKGYTHSSSGINNGQTFTNTKWTQEGKIFLYELLKSKGILPKIEQQGLELQAK